MKLQRSAPNNNQ